MSSVLQGPGEIGDGRIVAHAPRLTAIQYTLEWTIALWF